MRLPRSAFEGVVDVIETPDGGVRPLRLTADQLPLAPEPLALIGTFTSGVRLRLLTAASRIELAVDVERLVMAHLGEPANEAEFLAEVDGEIVARARPARTSLVRERHGGPWDVEHAPTETIALEVPNAGREREVTIWFPTDAGVTVRDVRADAAIASARPAPGRHWVHHGSSISQGGDAVDARRTWPAQVGRTLGIRWTNLGFGGNAQLDPMTAHSIASTDADVITLELGINVVGADAMRQRAFGSAAHAFLDLLRDRHPETPIVVLGAFACPAVESSQGPIRAGADGRAVGRGSTEDTGLTLQRSREILADVVARRADPRLHCIDGRDLFGPADVHHLHDGLHPDQSGLDLIASRFVAAVRDPSSPLARAFTR